MRLNKVEILFILVPVIIIGCNQIDIDSAEKYIKKSEDYRNINTIYLTDNKILINDLNISKGLNKLSSNFLDGIEMNRIDLEMLLKILKSTNAYGIDKNEKGQFYY